MCLLSLLLILRSDVLIFCIPDIVSTIVLRLRKVAFIEWINFINVWFIGFVEFLFGFVEFFCLVLVSLDCGQLEIFF